MPYPHGIEKRKEFYNLPNLYFYYCNMKFAQNLIDEIVEFDETLYIDVKAHRF